jgi:hypothetical protein
VPLHLKCVRVPCSNFSSLVIFWTLLSIAQTVTCAGEPVAGSPLIARLMSPVHWYCLITNTYSTHSIQLLWYVHMLFHLHLWERPSNRKVWMKSRWMGRGGRDVSLLQRGVLESAWRNRGEFLKTSENFVFFECGTSAARISNLLTFVVRCQVKTSLKPYQHILQRKSSFSQVQIGLSSELTSVSPDRTWRFASTKRIRLHDVFSHRNLAIGGWFYKSSSGSIVSDYRLDDRGSPTEAEDFSSSPYVQTGYGAHPASYPMDTGGPFPGGKARPGRDADHSPPSSSEVKKE